MNWQKLYGRKPFEEIWIELVYGHANKLVEEVRKFKKKMAGTNPGEITESLRRFSKFKVVNTAPYRKRRRHRFHAEGICEVCRKNKAIAQHHMILVSRGGTNKPYNRINICGFCHADIHEWLDVGESGDTDKFFEEFMAVTRQ